jgi:general secretion pathway protein G
MMRLRGKEKGFTLVELLAVVAIIAFLGAVITPNVIRAIEKSKISAAVTDSRVAKSAAQAFYFDTGQWPSVSSGGGDPGFCENPGVTGWDGPYLEHWPSKNPWGGTFDYYVGEILLFGGTVRCLRLSGVPGGVVEKLKESLGGSNVKEDSQYLYILFSKD